MNGLFSIGSGAMRHNAAMIDFGYPWWLSYGHLMVFAFACALLLLGCKRKWSRWGMILCGALAVWSGTAFLAVRTFDVNSKAALPTENFLRSGTGRVLDLGAGTGRSAIMLLTARPKATLVARSVTWPPTEFER